MCLRKPYPLVSEARCLIFPKWNKPWTLKTNEHQARYSRVKERSISTQAYDNARKSEVKSQLAPSGAARLLCWSAKAGKMQAHPGAPHNTGKSCDECFSETSPTLGAINEWCEDDETSPTSWGSINASAEHACELTMLRHP